VKYDARQNINSTQCSDLSALGGIIGV